MPLDGCQLPIYCDFCRVKILIKAYILAFFLSCCFNGFAQDSEIKSVLASKTDQKITIDGLFDEEDWQKAPIASGFSTIEPQPGFSLSQKSEIKILYDDKSIYIAARLLDESADSILIELSERDNVQNADWFALILDTYQDGLNGVVFGVTASGVQFDSKLTADDQGSNVLRTGDDSWDAVWQSKVKIDETGWNVEFRIPFSALRFPSEELQKWNLNFCRSIRRSREIAYWNEVDQEVLSLLQQSGTLLGIKNIQSPLRLSATPFLAGYIQNRYDANESRKSAWGRSFNGGMDIKYGINEAFTLDMTLIPDFGEANSDAQVLNLSPFEVEFNENRPFFTEGTELFNKGDLFYSRRIGGVPLHYNEVEDQLEDGEEIFENPNTSQLFNATKLSGRTSSGLGVGVFNAIAGRTFASIENAQGEKRNVETSSLTNYNVFVLDQNLKNNSTVSLINTNVWRDGTDYEANVTGLTTEINTKDLSYGLYGSGAISQKYEALENDFGHSYEIGLIKKRGALVASIDYEEQSDDFDINDLGFLQRANSREISLEANFSNYKPFFNGRFISGGTGLYSAYSRYYKPNEFNNFGINAWAWARTKGFTNFNLWTYFEPANGKDYFDPRTDDFSLYFKTPKFINVGGWISTDYRKKFAIDLNGASWLGSDNGSIYRNLGVAPRYRFSNKWSMRFNVNFEWFNKFYGYADTVDKDVIYGNRDVQTLINRLSTTYTFNNKMTFSFVARHYWSQVTYNSFYNLLSNGILEDSDYDEYADNSFNAFNIDAIYRWRFAPGSDLFIIWKNNIIGFQDELDLVQYNYSSAINGLSTLPINNSLSIKIIYFLDYQDFVK